MTTRILHTTITAIAVFAAGLAFATAADDILIADFEGTNYGNWKVEGKAFGTGPAKGTFPGQMEVTGFQGKGLVNTFLGGDEPTGKLTSPEFTIEREYLKFLIGGGGYAGKTCMNLLVDGKVVLSATGPNTEPGGSEDLNWENWDVRKYKGQRAVIEIVDAASGGWGHINVDDIRQSDTPAKKRPAAARRSQPAPPLAAQFPRGLGRLRRQAPGQRQPGQAALRLAQPATAVPANRPGPAGPRRRNGVSSPATGTPVQSPLSAGISGRAPRRPSLRR